MKKTEARAEVSKQEAKNQTKKVEAKAQTSKREGAEEKKTETKAEVSKTEAKNRKRKSEAKAEEEADGKQVVEQRTQRRAGMRNLADFVKRTKKNVHWKLNKRNEQII